MQTDATTPNNVGTCSASLERIQAVYKSLWTMRNERARPQQCWKSCANGSNIVALRVGDHGIKEMLGVVGWKVWPVSNFSQHATTSNNMQQGVQTDATCNIQQCWELLANNATSVCTGLKICTFWTRSNESHLYSNKIPHAFIWNKSLLKAF